MKKGDSIPNFSALDQDGRRITLDELVETGPLVLFFYPKAMTPG